MIFTPLRNIRFWGTLLPTKTLIIMRLIIFLTVVACFQASAGGYAQLVSISRKNVPIETIFKDIKQQTGFSFAYNKSWMDQTNKVTVDVHNVQLRTVLNLCFRDQPFTYEIIDNTISLKQVSLPPAKQPVLEQPAKDPNIEITVTAEDGTPLQGATVTIKDINISGITNAKGQFIHESIPPGTYKAEVTFIGFEKRIIEVTVTTAGGKSFITLKQSLNSLNETVIKGYYTTTKKLNVGDVTTVSGKDIAMQPVSNPLLALQGRVSGLQVVQNTGLPGKSPVVTIRGINSIRQGAGPLYVVDGVPFFVFSSIASFDNPSMLSTGNNYTSPLNSINPQDIESIEILKDADATAIYGTRGANGVILISTKKGKTMSGTRLDVTSYTGIGKATRTIKMLNTQEYLQMRHEAFANDGTTTLPANAYDINGTWDSTRYTDWNKKAFGGSAKYYDVQASLSGGNANTQFIVSGNFHKETTLFPGNFFDQRASVHVGVNHSSTDNRLKANLTAYYSNDNNQLPTGTSNFSTLAPDAPAVYDSAGNLNWQKSTWTNPFNYTKTIGIGITDQLNANANLSYQIVKGLYAKVNLGYSNTVLNQFQAQPITYFDPAKTSSKSNSTSGNNTAKTWIIEPQISYQLDLFGGRLETLVGSSFQQQNQQSSAVKGTQYSNDALIRNIAAATTIQYLGNTYSLYKYTSVFARIGYDWQSKYVINLTGRRDGSSRFGPDRQFANFGSAGAAWIFSNENLIKDHFSLLSFGKIRATYGLTGNDQIGDYQYLNVYNPYTSGTYLGGPTLSPRGLPNPEFGWETTKKAEFGLDLGLLHDRFQISGSYFINRSSNQLINASLPSFTGATGVLENLPATISNKGVELVISTINIRSTNFSWTTSLNLTIPVDDSKIISFPGLANSTYSSTYFIGQSITTSKWLHYTGIDPNTGLYTVEDYDKDGKITYPNDYQKLVAVGKQYYGGIQNNFSYKGWELNFLFQFVGQRNGNNFLAYGPAGAMINVPQYVYDHRWQHPGDKALTQKFTNSNSAAVSAFSYMASSDHAYSSASFVRLKNLSLSYQFPDALKKRMHFTNLRVYIQGQNLLTFTKYLGGDPETQSLAGIPPLKVLTGGIQISL